MPQTHTRRPLAGTSRRTPPATPPRTKPGTGSSTRRGRGADAVRTPKKTPASAPSPTSRARTGKNTRPDGQLPPWAQKRSMRGPLIVAVVLFLAGVSVALWIWSGNITPSKGTQTAPSATAPSNPASSSAPEGSKEEESGPTPADPQTAPAQVAAQNAIRELFTWQPTADASRGAALVRAQNWLTGNLLAQAQSYQGPPNGLRADTQWSRWKGQQAAITAEVAVTNVPEQKASEQTIELRVTQTAIAPQLPPQPAGKWRIRGTVVQTPGGWRLASYSAEVMP